MIRVLMFLLAAFLSGGVAAQDGHVLNFRDAELPVFIEDVAMLTGRTFIIDPQVRGKVTVISQTPLDRDEIFDVMQAVLQVNGFTALPTAGGVYKVVPLTQAAGSAPLQTGTAGQEDMVVAVFQLSFIDEGTADRMLRPLVSAGGQLITNRGTEYLIAVDRVDNIERMRRLLSQIDKDQAEVLPVKLENLPAEEAAELITRIAGRPGQEDGRRLTFTAIPVPRSNTVLLKGAADALQRYAATLRDLDSQAARDSAIQVISLNHAAAESLAPILTQVANELIASDAVAAAGGGSGRVSVAVHEQTNSLVVNAPPELQRALLDVVRQLDVRQPQVLVEAIVVEVSDTAARELGVQYVLGGAQDNVPFTITNFGSTAPNILAVTGAVVGDDQLPEDSAVLDTIQEAAVNSLLGLNGFAAGFAGITDNGTLFGFILNALDQDTDSNVLSTPSVVTLNNVPASLLVGQEIPITTGEALGTDNLNAFRTVDRQDVGIQLEVVPQINVGDAIQLEIRQEVSSIIGPVSAVSEDLILSKREIQTQVLVDDGEIIVLGGLIEDNEQISLDKVPLLGDIPGLGRLFRSEGRSRTRTNLMVFLRPTIVRDLNDLRRVTGRKYDYIRAEQILRSGSNSSSLDALVEDLLGAGPAAHTPPDTAPERPAYERQD
ncbi:MAG: type II secretion system secretin GspD [Rhodothalassiaceae bacterium]